MDELETTFMRKWGVKQGNLYYLTEFSAFKKNSSENVIEFTTRFNKLYYIIQEDIRHIEAATSATYAREFPSYFTIMPRER